MASIDKTAYPRFKRTISERELREAYSPTLEEMDWAREMTDTDENRLSLMVWLKCCQRLGRFPRLAEIPPQVISHVRDELGLAEDVGMAVVAERTGRKPSSPHDANPRLSGTLPGSPISRSLLSLWSSSSP